MGFAGVVFLGLGFFIANTFEFGGCPTPIKVPRNPRSPNHSPNGPLGEDTYGMGRYSFQREICRIIKPMGKRKRFVCPCKMQSRWSTTATQPWRLLGGP